MCKIALTDSDVKCNKIFIKKDCIDLFKDFFEKKIKVYDGDGEEFIFTPKYYQRRNNPDNEPPYLYDTRDFIEKWELKEGDSIGFSPSNLAGEFIVHVHKKGISSPEKPNEIHEVTPKEEKQEHPSLTPIDPALNEKISNAYNSVVSEYKQIFKEKHYLPTKTSNSSIIINGFTERNLTFNFCHSYKENNPESIIWQEIPINRVDREHVDSVIIDGDTVIFIESKRLYGLNHMDLLLDDLYRINNHKEDIPLPRQCKDCSKRIVLLLADVYYHGNSQYKKDKENCYDHFFKGDYDLIKGSRYDDIIRKMEMIDIKKLNFSFGNNLSIELKKNEKYNLDITDDINYTIYCGAWIL